MDQFISSLAPYLDKYGYWAVFAGLFLEGVGLPFPGETILIAAAFYSSRGELDLIPVLVIAWAATLSGTAAGYGIGWYGGRRLILRFGKYVFLNEDRLHILEDFFRRRGIIVALFARFLDVSRQLNGVVSGIACMPWRGFVFYNALGGALWVCFWGILSYKLGERVTRFGEIIKTREFYIILAVGAGVAITSFLLLRRHKKKERG